MELDWIENTGISAIQGRDSKEIWNWLSTQAESKYIQFVPDGYYCTKWDRKLRQDISKKIIKRLASTKDIDLVLGMGTWAGQILANNSHQIPVMIISCLDPLASGIIKNPYDSGYDHIYVHVDTLRFEMQIRGFYKTIRFKKLGIAYQDNLNGRSYAALDIVKQMAEQYGFEIIPCHTQIGGDLQKAEQSVIQCFKQLAEKADAIYVTMQLGVNPNTVPELVKIANKSHIPTFSQMGRHEVEQGILMTIEQTDFQYTGDFYAEIAAKILNKAVPRKLPMFFKQPYRWEFNFETAQKIGLDLSSLNLEEDSFYNPDF